MGPRIPSTQTLYTSGGGGVSGSGRRFTTLSVDGHPWVQRFHRRSKSEEERENRIVGEEDKVGRVTQGHGSGGGGRTEGGSGTY